jgi:hypothetical protein
MSSLGSTWDQVEINFPVGTLNDVIYGITFETKLKYCVLKAHPA